MATRSDVRRIALSFAETREPEGHFAFEVLNGPKYKGFAWVWMERVHPRKPRVANPGVLAVRVPNLDAKEILLMADDRTFFTEPHYDGFAAVLVRLAEISVAELRELLKQAWATQAPKALLEKQSENHGEPKPRAGRARAARTAPTGRRGLRAKRAG
jgi:hypothetical protein